MGQEQSSSSECDEDQPKDDVCRHICLISLEHDLHTFVNNLACEIRKGEISSLKGRVLVMIDFKKFNTKALYLPSRILLGTMFSNLEDPQLIKSYEWMMRNQQKLLFMIYSLDTYPYELVWKRHAVGYYTPSSADVVIHNLLSKHLFPNSIILSTSGQVEFEHIHPLCHPEYYVMLDGINDKTSAAHIRELIGKNPLEKSKKLHKNVWPQGPQFEQAMQAMGMRRNPGSRKSGYSNRQGQSGGTCQDRDMEAKRRILAEHMIESLVAETNERKRLEHLLTVYEGREASARVIRNSITEFDLSDVTFNDFDTEAVSFLIALAKNLNAINFRNCKLNASSMETMADHIMASSVKIDLIDISCNEVQARGMHFLAKIIKHCRVKSLNLSGCGVKLPHLQKLQAGTAGCKVPELDISQNDFGVDAMLCLGRLIKQWNVKYLTLSNCGVTLAHLKRFLDGCGGIMLESLDLSDWERYPVFAPPLLDFVTRVRRGITLHGWEIDEENRGLIQEKLNKTNSKVLVVYLNGGFELKARAGN